MYASCDSTITTVWMVFNFVLLLESWFSATKLLLSATSVSANTSTNKCWLMCESWLLASLIFTTVVWEKFTVGYYCVRIGRGKVFSSLWGSLQ